MKRWISVLLLLFLFIGMTFATARISIDEVTTFAKERNQQKTELVTQRIGDTLDLLEQLSEEEYIRSEGATYEEKAVYLTDKNENEQLGYMMLRILDSEINIYREGIGLASNLASREYMQKMYATGEQQVTDAFLAGADGKTINYTVTAAIQEEGQVTGALMAAIYGSEIDGDLQDEDCVHVLVGSQLQYMGGVSQEQFGLAVAQVLESETRTSRPVENILLDFQQKQDGSFWGLGGDVKYFTYAHVERTDWVVMTEVSVFPMIRNLLIVYGCGVVLLIVVGALLLRRKPA